VANGLDRVALPARYDLVRPALLRELQPPLVQVGNEHLRTEERPHCPQAHQSDRPGADDEYRPEFEVPNETRNVDAIGQWLRQTRGLGGQLLGPGDEAARRNVDELR